MRTAVLVLLSCLSCSAQVATSLGNGKFQCNSQGSSNIVATAASGISGTATLNCSATASPIFDEEFNGTTLDTTKWTAVNKFGSATINPVYYTTRQPQNINESGGMMTLIALHDNFVDGNGTHPYTSGYIWTRGLESFNGNLVFEVRAKMSAGDGMHPTFWFLNDSGDTFSMMEMEGNNVNDVYSAIDPNAANHYQGGPCPNIDFTAAFHIFRLEWDNSTSPSTFRSYVDGCLYVTQQHDTSSGNYYFITNLASVGYTGGIDSTTPFPNNFFLDYVRAYNLNGAPPPP